MTDNFDADEINYCVFESKVSKRQAEKVLSLFKEDCTVPFIARYRKEATGNLNETQIRAIEAASSDYKEREKRRKNILVALEKMGSLSPDLKLSVESASTLVELEDLYAPHKSKKKTKAEVAKENGLEPLAIKLLTSNEKLEKHKENFKESEKVKTFEEAVEGAKNIIIEKIAQNPALRSMLRDFYKASAKFESTFKKGGEEIKDHIKFKDYFNFSEQMERLFSPKSSHRFLAMLRGKNLKILTLSITVDLKEAIKIITEVTLPDGVDLGCPEILYECTQSAYKKSLQPSLETEFLAELKKIAEEAAIHVFCGNLKNLLLAPYLGAKHMVMGIDPGIRTGCKVAVIDPTGKFVLDFVIYPNEEPKKAKAKEELEKVIEALQIKHITIGDGTYGREALEFVEKNIDAVKSGEVKAMLTSEAGASVYSASQVAIDEFPDKDITVRGAISIARRFQDPLSELVKIEPKSIGVGQYQHDVHQGKLKRSLGGVVEDCVNHVGVDLNTASFHVLSFISGIGPALSKNIVAHRDKNGKFLNRKDLLKVDRFSEKIFEQAAGFMRIYDSAHPLDRTFVHPERYLELEKWCSENGHEVSDLLGEGETLQKLSKDETVTKSMGELTFQDVLLSLRAPSQDPRTVFKSTEFKKGLKSLADLKVGDWYPGVINNITNFGAFVNIGIKESGLIHISQMSEKFVEDPLKIVKVGQEVKVRVLEIDKERNRLALSCKSEFNGSEPKVGGAFGENRPHRRRPMRQEFRQNKPQESSNSDRSRPPSRGAGSGHIQEQHKARLEFNKHPRLSSRADSRSGAKPKSRTESRPSGRTDSRGKSERFERPRRADGARPGQFNTRFQGKASAAPPGHQNKDKKEDPNSPFAALKNFKVKQ